MTNFLNFFIRRQVYSYYFLRYIIEERFLKDQKACNKFAIKLLDYNNNINLEYVKKNKPKRVSILLPHCIQNYECIFRITSNIENCKKCGKCKIGDMIELKNEYNISIKVATGGTLARLYLREERPDFIIAVACKRDLVTGIYEMFPLKVYGVFNKINESPCINTDVDIFEIKRILDLVLKKGE